MSWHVHGSMAFAGSDAYGIDTDNPETPYEIIDNTLTGKDEKHIKELYAEAESFDGFVEEMARKFFHVGGWDGSWWDAWEEKIYEIIR